MSTEKTRPAPAQAPAEGMVLIVHPASNGADPAIYPRQSAGWLDLLTAGARLDADVELHLGKEPYHVPRGGPLVILCGGVIRCRLPFKKVSNGVYGFSLVVTGADIIQAVPVTVEPELLLRRWHEAAGKPGPLFFPGARPVWWNESDESPFPSWVDAGLDASLAEEARRRFAGFARKLPPEPAPAPPPARPRPAPAAPPLAAPPIMAAAPPKPAKAAPAAPLKPAVEAAPPGPQRSLFDF